jgi:hypothetical protein
MFQYHDIISDNAIWATRQSTDLHNNTLQYSPAVLLLLFSSVVEPDSI